ncbi:MAG TPA: glycosyl hydrolase [Thermoanaerobaculia bacterium]|nr:glycosyl hydrolase [Thermoanaerobaculia bacterium]
MSRNRLGVLLAAAALAASAALADPSGSAPGSATTIAEKGLSDRFEGLEFRLIGPFRGGRVTAVAGVRHDPYTFYFGATGGGVWKTTDGGSNWQVVSDKDFRTGSIGAIAVAESDPNVIYVGTGEEPIRGNVSHGDGVYKSTDAGRSWKNVGLRDSRQIARVRVHPSNPDLVYVAAQGHVWGPNAERGIFRSEDGGKTWKKILYVDEKTGASDLAMDPGNPRVLYAAFWQVVRHPWELVSGGAGSSLWKSTDGGDTWKKLTEGLPEGLWGKVGVAVAPSKPGRVYAFVEAKHGGLFRSEDFGAKFTHVNDEHKIRERAWYYSWVYPDPKNADVVYLPNVEMHRSNDGGKSFATMRVPHGDNHDMWIDPDDPGRFIVGNDGGATITFNGGRSWSTLDNQPTAQFYRVTTDNQFPYWVYGSQQDNSNVCIPSGVVGDGIDRTDWHPAGGGESGWMAVDPKDSNVVYAGEYGGVITRYDHRTKQSRIVMAWPQLADGHATSDLKYRFQWNAPIMISPNDPKALYHASQILLRSRDAGETWEEISPDLTRNDKSKQGKSGGPITIDVTGVELYGVIFALGESTAEPGVIWAGSDDGLVHVTRDDGRTWQNVTPKGMPEWIQINAIEASPRTKGTAYVAATMYKWDDFRPYLYKTTDYGKTWTKITNGIPDGAFTRVVREDPVRPGLLYAGTEIGLYVSFDDGASWQPFQRNLPYTPIADLAVKDGDLVVATQGRAFWILDDLTALRQWSDSIGGSAAHLFPPRPTVRFDVETPREGEGGAEAAGTNVPAGVVVDYWLKETPKDGQKVTLEFLDGDTVLRSSSNQKAPKVEDLKKRAAQEEGEKDRDKPLEPKAGVNRFVWDLRVMKPSLVPKAVFNEGTKAPPKVAPGTYAVRLTVDGKSSTQPIEVRPHPAGAATAADLKAQYDLLKAIRDRLSETHDTVLAIRDVRAQVEEVGARAERLGKGDALAKQAAAVAAKLTAVEEQLTNPLIVADEDDLNYEPKLDHDWVYLAAVVASADAKPLATSVQYYGLLAGRLDAIRAQYTAVLDTDVKAFNQAVAAAAIPPVAPAPPKAS